MNKLSTVEDIAQALKCVEYRLPKEQDRKGAPFAYTLALRYGLIVGVAALNTLAQPGGLNRDSLIRECRYSVWQHSFFELPNKLAEAMPAQLQNRVHIIAAEIADQLVTLTLKGLELRFSLLLALHFFERKHRGEILKGTPYFLRLSQMRSVRATNMKSLGYALNFLARRRACLDEVPEIALLDE